MTEQLGQTQAIVTVRDYCCAACWGDLEKVGVGGGDYIVRCRADHSHAGFVTRYWVDKQRQADYGNIIDALYTLRQVGIVKRPPRKSSEQILAELGYEPKG